VPKKWRDLTAGVLLIAVAASFFLYEVARALRVALTYDEATTYFTYVRGGLLSIFNFDSANNHFLNSFLSKVFSFVGGNSPFVLRLPNLLGYALFLAFSYLILRKFGGRTFALAGLLALNLNAYLLDFFSLSRGYGLSLALLMPALFFFLTFAEKVVRGDPDCLQELWLSLGAAAAAVLANMTLMPFFLSLVLIGLALLVSANANHPGFFGACAHRKFSPARRRTAAAGLIIGVILFNVLVAVKEPLLGTERHPIRDIFRTDALSLGAFAVAALIAAAIGRELARRRLINVDQFRPLAVATLTLGGLLVLPFYLLKSKDEFYWGGKAGLIHDAFNSLINGSTYGDVYLGKGHPALLVAAGLFLAGFFVLALVHFRKKSLTSVLPAGAILAVLALTILALRIEKTLFQTPSLMGRTALYFIPLAVLFIAFTLHSLAAVHPAAKIAAAMLGIAVLSVLAVIFAQKANTGMALEWRCDADSARLVQDLRTLKDQRLPDRPRLKLGADLELLPVLRYYIAENGLAWLDVAKTATRFENDFYYFRGESVPSRMILIGNYPRSGNILVRAKDPVRD
jgi:hypothetical protein